MGSDSLKIVLPTGDIGSSFDTEVFATVDAFYTPADRESFPRHILWFTDSQSCIEALLGNPKSHTRLIRKIWNIIDSVPLYCHKE